MIQYFNIDELLQTHLNSTIKKSKDVTSVLIQWIPTKKGVNQKKAGALLSQTDILEKYVKTHNIVIFDKDRSITDDEYNYLKKFKVTFFEPCITPRQGFKYLPHWTKIKSLTDISLNDTKRNVNLGYIGSISDKIKSFEKYYIKTKELDSTLNVSYDSKVIPDSKVQEYKNQDVLNTKLNYNDIEFTVILGSYSDYIVGHLDQYFFKALENNCIPIIPRENRYFGNIPYTIIDEIWYNDYIKMYDKIYIGIILDIYEHIKKYYPEMSVEYTTEVIKKYLGEK